MSEIPIDKDRVIVVDDEKSMRDFLSIMLKKEGYLVETFPDGESALEYFSENNCDLIIADVRMPGMGGVELLKKVKELEPSTVVMVMTAYASVDTAVDAMKSGAYDYFTKPFNVDDIKLHIDRALKWRRLERENELLKKNLKSAVGLGGLIGNSRLMREVYEMIMSIASSKASVLITGESGTGKELVAWAIHDESQRKDASFVPVNCGAIPENLIESELFGHQKGAFTGATSNKAGLVEKASGGTLFLDEIGEMPPSLQVKLLRFLQEKIIRRVGGVNDIAVDIRVIVATNKDLEAEVAAGNFREDLFYRLNV
ncbi:MAG: sigma-54-dependent Fis family transcriptional regulator, partial [Deltaproteobacteria bacterium]|nr:sigma-54-dependent Fis family transcriptional regulator [Deltaproteobacteria bacterium]